MGKHSANEKGFTVVELILVLMVVALIGAAGFLVYKKHHDKTKATPVATTNTSTTQTKTTPTPDAYAGWTSCKDATEGLSFKYPSAWSVSGLGTGGACTTDSEHQLAIYSPQASGTPYFFRVEYFPSRTSDGVIDGDNGTETILSVHALNVANSKKPLYLVSFNAPGSSSSSDVFEFVLTDQSYTVGQKVDHVVAASSQKVGGNHYQLTANLVTSKDQQYLGQYTLAQYQAQPDYNNIVKLFESLSY
ncbi:MAG TPA: prepilin-type N-terminal cleavage/methylation domain-containing protein [Candidatus Saccharimonadales bacterium]|nr:prepilin-type N-terminal cleavage/methylation domain-containing protein [Candidatus Saccharimonadales bacterium]